MTFPGRGSRPTPRRTVAFILSSPQSGSTWIGYVLGSGPESAFVGEYNRAWKESIRVPCTICAARGLQSCEVLYDVEKEPAERAFDLAFARTGKRVIVDSSKELEWIRTFMISDSLDIRIVHLVRDPRGFFASVKRRAPVDVGEIMAHWSNENRKFCDFITASGLPSLTVSYGLAAESPESEFRRLFEFCGMKFTTDSLSYWNVEHHGFAANGASDAILKAKAFPNVPGHFVTGDVAFYGENSQTLFHDQRWRSALESAELAAIENNAEVQNLLKSLGFALTDKGLAREAAGSVGEESADRRAGAR
jgi:Sulfotransferase family